MSARVRRPARGKLASSAGRLARGIDDRTRAAAPLKRAMDHLFPDHWSFLLGELALYSFIILVITGIFLTLFFHPSMTDEIYQGSYRALDGTHMSQAYASTLKISFDVRGGLLMRQIHHWAALLFIAAIVAHLLRIFFSGAFRRPRELNWVIGTTLFALACAEGFAGYSLPDDLLSGTGLRIADGIMLSIPVIGSYISFFVFGGQYPGHEFIPRLYVVHVLLIPGLLAALIAAHLFAVWHQEHTEWPSHRTREKRVVGEPLFPVFVAKTQALFFFVFSVLALLAAVAQINPIWLYGPYTPASASSNSTPDWYIGFLEGSLRLMPATATNAGGYTFAWNVFIPAVLLPVLFFTLMYGYPFFEQWATGDRRHHHILDRPRNVPARTALGAAIIAMALDLLLSAADDVISFYFQVPLFILVWVLRVGFFAFPVIAFVVARHVCLALQQRDRERLAAGMDTGIIRALPDGSYAPERRPVPEEVQAGMRAERAERLIYPTPRHLVPLPTPRRIGAQVRSRLNHFYTRYQQETLSGEDGQGRAESPAAADGERPAGPGPG